MEKVWIQFSDVFWDNSRQWLVVANELEGGASTLFLNYNIVFPGSNLLLTFVRESQRLEMGETIDVAKVIKGLTNLQSYHTGITYESEVTTWKEDPNFDGSWETWQLDGTYPDFELGIQPQGKLHKAGSAYCTNFWGFTWGAIFNGVWNADWIANRIAADPSAVPSTLAPYTPCTDEDRITNPEMRRFYQEYGSLFEP